MIRDTELVLVVNALNQVRAGGLLDDLRRHAQVPCEGPYLRLEEVAERVDRRGVVGVPSVVAQQALALVAGAQRERAQLGRLVKKDERALARGQVPAAERRDFGLVSPDVGVDRIGDRQRPFPGAGRRNHEVRVFEALGTGRGVGKPEAEHVLRSERPAGQEEGHRRIHAPGHSDHDPRETPPPHHLLADELHERRLHQVRIDGERFQVLLVRADAPSGPGRGHGGCRVLRRSRRTLRRSRRTLRRSRRALVQRRARAGRRRIRRAIQ